MRGAGIKEVQDVLGRKSCCMTVRYAHLGLEHKKKAVNLLNGLTAPPPSADMSQSVFPLVTFRLSS
jgi:hypothetical protein